MHDKIQNQIPEAMRAKDQVRLLTLRGIVAAFVNEAVALKRKPTDKLSDEEAATVIKRLVKQRKDSIEQFEKGGRKDLADNERAELKVLEEFMPPSMSREKIKEIALAKKAELGISDKSKMGHLMGAIMKEAKGAAEGEVVKEVVEELFEAALA